MSKEKKELTKEEMKQMAEDGRKTQKIIQPAIRQYMKMQEEAITKPKKKKPKMTHKHRWQFMGIVNDLPTKNGKADFYRFVCDCGTSKWVEIDHKKEIHIHVKRRIK